MAASKKQEKHVALLAIIAENQHKIQLLQEEIHRLLKVNNHQLKRIEILLRRIESLSAGNDDDDDDDDESADDFLSRFKRGDA